MSDDHTSDMHSRRSVLLGGAALGVGASLGASLGFSGACLSSRECIAGIAEEGGVTVAAACLIDRSGGKADLGVPLYALTSLEIPAYAADALPLELAAIPAIKPGSRSINK